MVNKNRETTKHLFQEIVENNYLVEKTISKFNNYNFIEDKVEQLKRAKICPGEEMEGKGLRRTYVTIGRNWLEAAYISRWEKEVEDFKKERIMQKRRKQLLNICASLFIFGNIFFYSYTLYNDITPAFGSNMKCVRSGELLFDDLTKFTNSIFSEVKQKTPINSFSFLNKSLPPELQAMWSTNLNRIKDASRTSIDRILIDPKRKGIYYITCEADIPNLGDIEFRLQCSKIDGKYALLALE